MEKFTKLNTLSISVIVLVLCFTRNLNAQRITGPSSTVGCFRQTVLPIISIPTLHSDMGFDCLVGYIYLDSLCRASLNRTQLDSIFGQIRSWDTLKVFMRFKYRMTEYNSDLYEEYTYGSYGLSTYKTTPGTIDYLLHQRIDSILGNKNKLTYLTDASVILHIRVENVYSDADSLGYNPINPIPLRCVTATILDTIKGKYIRQCEPFYSAGTNQQTQSITSHCISINYFPYREREHSRGDMIGVGADSSGAVIIPCANCYGNNAMEIGKEYIVFLRNNFLDNDGTNSYYSFSPLSGFSSEGGVFSISSSGNVLMPSNFFGYGTSLSLSSFKTSLINDINIITTH